MTKRATLFFGNGLGMALDPEKFSLENAIKHVWENSTELKKEHKSLISSAILETGEEEPPTSEEQLDLIQIAIDAIDVIKRFKTNRSKEWLTEDAKDIPASFRKFIHAVALRFYYDLNSFTPTSTFSSNLCSFIKLTKSHVITTNYDGILYRLFLQHKVLDGLKYLIDGFMKTGLDLIRYYDNDFGYFLHIHGSALYIDDKKREACTCVEPHEKCNIVLTHIRHKMKIINSSSILRYYWRFFRKALEESTTIFLVGYSGLDEHINELFQQHKDKHYVIVQWSGDKEKIQSEYWSKKLGADDINIVPLENILDFNEWENYFPPESS